MQKSFVLLSWYSVQYKPAEINCVEDLYFLVRRDLLVDDAGDAALHNPVIYNDNVGLHDRFRGLLCYQWWSSTERGGGPW